jgi:hypothetical protein
MMRASSVELVTVLIVSGVAAPRVTAWYNERYAGVSRLLNLASSACRDDNTTSGDGGGRSSLVPRGLVTEVQGCCSR